MGKGISLLRSALFWDTWWNLARVYTLSVEAAYASESEVCIVHFIIFQIILTDCPSII